MVREGYVAARCRGYVMYRKTTGIQGSNDALTRGSFWLCDFLGLALRRNRPGAAGRPFRDLFRGAPTPVRGVGGRLSEGSKDKYGIPGSVDTAGPRGSAGGIELDSRRLGKNSRKNVADEEDGYRDALCTRPCFSLLARSLVFVSQAIFIS